MTVINPRNALTMANRVLAGEKILDAFGHVSLRDPGASDRFWLACSKAPELVRPDDILQYGLNGEPVEQTSRGLYIERFIHGAIYQARPDVNAIAHHHAPGVMPFCVAGVPIIPVYQHGAMIGREVPIWDSRIDFGDTNMLVSNYDQASSLASALGLNWLVLMRHHGATVVGRSLEETVFRSVTSTRNAEFQLAAMSLGPIAGLTPGEIDKAGNLPPGPILRAWQHWAGKIKQDF